MSSAHTTGDKTMASKIHHYTVWIGNDPMAPVAALSCKQAAEIAARHATHDEIISVLTRRNGKQNFRRFGQSGVTRIA